MLQSRLLIPNMHISENTQNYEWFYAFHVAFKLSDIKVSCKIYGRFIDKHVYEICKTYYIYALIYGEMLSLAYDNPPDMIKPNVSKGYF